ncbi:MAG TPA: isoamylase early set domain-containing protein [Polyangia bacterium]
MSESRKDEGDRCDADFVDAVMRQIATRPLPRRSWWRRLVATREVTLRFRPVSFAVGAVAVAMLALVVARPRHGATTVAVHHPAAAPAPDAPVVVRFALAASAAHEVSLAGDFNGWRPDATPMLRGADGVWTVQVPLSHGNWSYSFVVDGKWVEDPLAESWRADGFGGKNAVVRVGDVPEMLGSARGG